MENKTFLNDDLIKYHNKKIVLNLLEMVNVLNIIKILFKNPYLIARNSPPIDRTERWYFPRKNIKKIFNCLVWFLVIKNSEKIT